MRTTRVTDKNNGALPGVRGRGRPREFDVEKALDKAIILFGERGFHSTSTKELARTMGLTAGSLFKAFKDKRDVFLAALDRQMTQRNQDLMAEVEAAQTGRSKIHKILMDYASVSHGAQGRCGCLVVGTAVDLSTFDAEVAARVLGSLKKREQLLVGLIHLGQTDGSISGAVVVKATARCMLCLLQGLRVVGKTSPARAEMAAAVNIAMKLLD